MNKFNVKRCQKLISSKKVHLTCSGKDVDLAILGTGLDKV